MRSLSPYLALLALLPLQLAGCSRPPRPPEEPKPFEFRSLNLRQQDAKGRPAWELISPEARYDTRSRVARAKQPRGVIYSAGKPQYRISAISGTVINDGEVIQLEGGVRIQIVGSRPAVISGDRVRWTPRRQLIEIDRRPVATERSSRISAGTARFLLDRDKLELRGPTRLQQPELDLRVSQADWYPGSGVLQAAGPVRGERRPKDDKRRVQTLTASALEGNTRDEVIDALAPVLFVDPAAKAVLRTQRTRWNARDGRLSTDLPFDGRVDRLEVQGGSLVALLGDSTVLVPSDCRVRQPGERLRARECRWNWKTQAIEASGDVLLERDANRQITRSQRLTGRLGARGLADFTTPGGRVESQLTVPPPSDRPRSRAPVSF